MQRFLLIFIILILAAVSLIVKVDGVDLLVSDNVIRLASTAEAPAAPAESIGSVLNSANLSANISDNLISLNCQISYGAKAALAGELNKSALFEFNSDNYWPIASLTKLMAALIALENFPLNKEIQITGKSVFAEGQAANFKQGEIFTVRDLIKAMIIVSSNDAASALAETLGESKFVNLMNQKAAQLMMKETSFVSPSGFSLLNQSTAKDLKILINSIYDKNQWILTVSQQKETEILDLNSNKTRKLTNINQFAGQENFLGGKSGYLESSGRNLISLFGKNGKIMSVIVLGAEDAYKETENLLKCLQ